ncbi:MAG: hypothetical protein GY750_15250 [Lentisphaerae bacterium]|nr:hypothetical protein [Lentisphaerota bacterium]MCP4102754.1 hypothetical protein [Lentisphaerota bacterium]
MKHGNQAQEKSPLRKKIERERQWKRNLDKKIEANDLKILEARKAGRKKIMLAVADKAGVDLEKIDKDAQARHKAERRKADEALKEIREDIEKKVIKERREFKVTSGKYIKTCEEAYKKRLSNPSLRMKTPAEWWGETRTRDFGVRGSRFEFPIQEADPDFLVEDGFVTSLHPRCHVDARSDIQCEPAYATTQQTMIFRHSAPTMPFFFVGTVWVSLAAMGTCHGFAGDGPCLPCLVTSGRGVSLHLDVSVSQDGPWGTELWTDVINERIHSYSLGGEEGGLTLGEPIIFSRPFRAFTSAMMLISEERGGGPVNVIVTLTCSAATFYKDEYHNISFEHGVGEIRIPEVTLVHSGY